MSLVNRLRCCRSVCVFVCFFISFCKLFMSQLHWPTFGCKCISYIDISFVPELKRTLYHVPGMSKRAAAGITTVTRGPCCRLLGGNTCMLGKGLQGPIFLFQPYDNYHKHWTVSYRIGFKSGTILLKAWSLKEPS